MANLLDAIFASSADDPRYQANMQLFTRMMEGNAPAGFRESGAIMAGAKDQALKRSLLEAQIEETKAQADARKLAAEQARRKQDLIASVFGNGTPSQPAMPGQLGSGSFGAVSAPAGQPAIPPAQPGYRLASMNPDQIAMLKLNEMDILEPWKIAKQGFEQKPGMYRIDPNTGKMSYIMDPRDGRTVDASGRIGLAPGATEATLESGFAAEFPKTVANALGTVNMRKGENGKEYPVTSITENPTLQSVVDRYFPGLRQNVGAPTAAPASPAPASVAPVAPAAPARPASVAAQPGVTGSFDITDPSLLAGINDIKDPQERANALAALKQQQAAINAANGTPNPSQGYGKTTAQEARDKASASFQDKIAQNQAETLVKNFDTLQNIPQTLQALESAKGYLAKSGPFVGSGAETKLALAKFFNNNLGTNIDPTGVKNAEALQSALFYNVMDNLKKMDASPSQQQQKYMQDAFGRLTTDPAALPLILDFYKQQVTSKAIEHNRRVQEAMDGPTGVQFPYDLRIKLPEAKSTVAPPAPTPGMVRGGYRFKGGNPADPKSWEKQ